MSKAKLSTLPQSWSSLTWQQLCAVWSVKQRFGGNADVARAAALLSLTIGEGFEVQGSSVSEQTGETVYVIKDKAGLAWLATAREIAYAARQAMPWFDFPYGDPGEKEVKDDKGTVVKEARDPVNGYVGPMRDAMSLPENDVVVARRRFALPQVAMNNLTWQQYRSLQAVAPQLFADGITEEQAVSLQAQFMAHMLVPRSMALLDTTGGSIRLRPHWEYRYDTVQAEGMVGWWKRQLAASRSNGMTEYRHNGKAATAATLFHILFQVYQTAIGYYAKAYPLLFSGDSKGNEYRDALQGEVGTINTVMKYAGYAEQQQVYDSNLPFVLDILNTMTKEAKEIEKMNAKIKRK